MIGAPLNGGKPAPAAARKILFVAATTLDIASILREPLEDFEVVRSKGTAETVALVIAGNFSHVVVDLSFEDGALALLVPLLASSDHDFKLYIIAEKEHVGQYLRIRGVDRVFAGGDAEKQIRAAISASIPQPEQQEPATEIVAPQIASPPAPAGFSLNAVRNRFTRLVSALYKNTAFVLLAVLFAAFCFYGLLIAYFLVASGWGAPVTLSRGHELVNKVEQQLADMRVNANLTSQRQSEARLEASEAERAKADAELLVTYVTSTIDGEIAARKAKLSSMQSSIARQKKLKASFDRELGQSGLSAKLRRLYSKRIIDRKTMESNTLGMLEASQRMAGIEAELATANNDVASLMTTLEMLAQLRSHLETGMGKPSSASSADLLLLTKQAVDARSALSQSEVQLASAHARLKLLEDSARLFQQRMAEIEASALGRAVNGRVDVIFVPYGNGARFQRNAPLYSCTFTFIWCRRVGVVGGVVPGEANAVHPFFGKPIRGTFVEAELTDPSAASEEIIHAGRPPFLF